MTSPHESPRIFILELINGDTFNQQLNDLVPYVRAAVLEWGLPLRHLRFGYDQTCLAGGPLAVELDPGDLETIRAALRDFRPTLVMINQQPGPVLDRWVRDAAPGARRGSFFLAQVNHSFNLALLLGLSPTRPRSLVGKPGMLFDLFQPDYGGDAGNEQARTIKPMVKLLGGPTCLYQRSLTDNPHYQGLDEEMLRRHRGCSFCHARSGIFALTHNQPIKLAMEQIDGVLRTMDPQRRSNLYLLENNILFQKIEAFVEQVLTRNLPPSIFLVSCRMDELVRKRASLEALLPRLEEAGHQIAVSNMGVENFSPEENSRLNKGLSPEILEQARLTIIDLETRFPKGFSFHRFGGFGFILFTPWTRIEDLRINLEAATRFKIHKDSFLFTSRLALIPGRPITELARRDRALTESFGQSGGAMSSGAHATTGGQVISQTMDVPDNPDQDLPWRFLNPEIALVYRFQMRFMDNSLVPRDDPDLALVRSFRARLPRDLDSVYVILPKVLDLMEQPGRISTVGELLDLLGQNLPLVGKPAAAPSGCNHPDPAGARLPGPLPDHLFPNKQARAREPGGGPGKRDRGYHCNPGPPGSEPAVLPQNPAPGRVPPLGEPRGHQDQTAGPEGPGRARGEAPLRP